MSCKQEWDRSFVYRQLPASLVYKELKVQREKQLVERETALLPATSQVISLKKTEGKIKAEVDNLKKELRKKMDELAEINRQKAIIEHDMLGRPAPAHAVGEKKEESITQKILCHCPADGCRGFVFNNYKCSLCEVMICKSCYVILSENAEHSCKPEDVASVQCIKKECKPCPGCGAPSRKTEGCSQVWCLVCHKAWDWSTGRLDNGAIHATDYFNYMRRNGMQIPGPRQQAQNDCRPLNMAITIEEFKRQYPEEISSATEKFLVYRWRVTREYTRQMNDTIHPSNNIDLRCKFLNGELDNDKWKQLLHKRDKANTFNTEIHRMRCAYTAAMMDAFRSMSRVKTAAALSAAIVEVRELHAMMEGEYKKLAACFKSKKVSPFVHHEEY